MASNVPDTRGRQPGADLRPRSRQLPSQTGLSSPGPSPMSGAHTTPPNPLSNSRPLPLPGVMLESNRGRPGASPLHSRQLPSAAGAPSAGPAPLSGSRSTPPNPLPAPRSRPLPVQPDTGTPTPPDARGGLGASSADTLSTSGAHSTPPNPSPRPLPLPSRPRTGTASSAPTPGARVATPRAASPVSTSRSTPPNPPSGSRPSSLSSQPRVANADHAHMRSTHNSSASPAPLPASPPVPGHIQPQSSRRVPVGQGQSHRSQTQEHHRATTSVFRHIIVEGDEDARTHNDEAEMEVDAPERPPATGGSPAHDSTPEAQRIPGATPASPSDASSGRRADGDPAQGFSGVRHNSSSSSSGHLTQSQGRPAKWPG